MPDQPTNVTRRGFLNTPAAFGAAFGAADDHSEKRDRSPSKTGWRSTVDYSGFWQR